MAGKLRATFIVFMLLAAGLVVTGVLLSIEGAGATPRATSFVGTSVFRDPLKPYAVTDASHWVTFDFSLVTDQPWLEDGNSPYSAVLGATLGRNVTEVRIGTLGVFVCTTQCSESRYLYADNEPLNRTGPSVWTTYPGTMEPLNGFSGAAPAYVTFNVAMLVFYADGNSSSLGWWSNLYLGPLRTVPDNVLAGQGFLAWGVVLFVPAATVVFFYEREQRRSER